ncbi:hypothetical protein P175DRAFT_0526600 [Aspergillus ochraceoroseus IBT 24754]|uniref:Uncharacterized protein n=1 Tax=Aspergillus ochraceoroseus IBT 24754 TaxID=1392256 RepID=A0A2T5LMQ8_9EURO|nr:uncharacterized protein P175DRAFT_0526600 [Aspergillus ochraceoroseus IBT 24754]PTU17572.1 hypothetical protein P175DRAFT_0526600 [Aspergillus ochraceoroseus IBT 24754]
MEPPKRQWDPSAPAMLWAHEMRRENIQLVNQIDLLQADLSSALSTINTLKETIDVLTLQLQHSQHEADLRQNSFEKKLSELEESYQRQLTSALGRIQTLQNENSQVRGNLDAFETKYAAQAAEWSRLMEGLLCSKRDTARSGAGGHSSLGSLENNQG